MTAPELKSRRWQTFRKGLIATLPPYCHICGGHVDKRLPGTDPDGPTIDHIRARHHGGKVYDKTNCALAHQRCNASKGARGPIHSRNW